MLFPPICFYCITSFLFCQDIPRRRSRGRSLPLSKATPSEPCKKSFSHPSKEKPPVPNETAHARPMIFFVKCNQKFCFVPFFVFYIFSSALFWSAISLRISCFSTLRAFGGHSLHEFIAPPIKHPIRVRFYHPLFVFHSNLPRPFCRLYRVPSAHITPFPSPLQSRESFLPPSKAPQRREQRKRFR